MRTCCLLTIAVLIAGCAFCKDWHVGAALGPVCCLFCFAYGYAAGKESCRTLVRKILHIPMPDGHSLIRKMINRDRKP